MILYTLMWSILFICSFLEISQNKNRYSNVINTLLFFILNLMAGLRYKVGADYSNYFRFYELSGTFAYNELYQVSRRESIDLGYLFLNKFFFKITPHYYYFQLIYVSIIMILLKLFIEKYYPEYRNNILFGFYSLYYHRGLYALVRQSLCLILLLYFYQFFIVNKDKAKSFLIICVSPLFHISSLLSVSVYFIKFLKKIIIPLFICSIIIGRYLKPIAFKFINILGDNYFFTRRLLHYLENKPSAEIFLSLGFIQKNLYFIIFYYFLLRKKKIEISFVYLIAVIFYNFLYFDLNLAERFSQNLFIIEIIIFPLFICSFYRVRNRRIVFILISLYFASKFIKEINLYLPDYNGKIYFPYRTFIFQEKIDGEIFIRE